jgi:hypothetical protein
MTDDRCAEKVPHGLLDDRHRREQVITFLDRYATAE